MVVAGREQSTPPLFDIAVQAILNMSWRPELKVEEIPAPAKIAPFAVAISAEVELNDEELGSGRLVLLHDPAGSPSWDGDFRCVTYARADVDPEMVTDPLLTEVGWSWLIDALDRNQAEYCSPSGTVTAVSSRSFGGIADDPPRAEVELRASWTPMVDHRRRCGPQPAGLVRTVVPHRRVAATARWRRADRTTPFGNVAAMTITQEPTERTHRRAAGASGRAGTAVPDPRPSRRRHP